MRLKLKCDVLLSTSAFRFNLRCYTKGGSCPDSGWEFGGQAALELSGFGFEAEGEGLYNCDVATVAAVGYQWKFEFNLDHAEIVMVGRCRLPLSNPR